jgi:predicted Fe-Mo cluster-binding NifX family protein
MVISGELGPGASALLKQQNVKMVRVKTGIKVSKAIREVFGKS